MVDMNQTNISKFQKVVKYILMALIVILALMYIPQTCMEMKEMMMIGAVSAIMFAIFDMLSPTIKIYKKDNITIE